MHRKSFTIELRWYEPQEQETKQATPEDKTELNPSSLDDSETSYLQEIQQQRFDETDWIRNTGTDQSIILLV